MIRKKIPLACALDGIVITRYHTRRTLDKMVENDVRERYKELVFETKIRENATIVQAPVVSLDIVSYDPKCNGTVDYRALMREILLKYEKQV